MAFESNNPDDSSENEDKGGKYADNAQAFTILVLVLLVGKFFFPTFLKVPSSVLTRKAKLMLNNLLVLTKGL